MVYYLALLRRPSRGHSTQKLICLEKKKKEKKQKSTITRFYFEERSEEINEKIRKMISRKKPFLYKFKWILFQKGETIF